MGQVGYSPLVFDLNVVINSPLNLVSETENPLGSLICTIIGMDEGSECTITATFVSSPSKRIAELVDDSGNIVHFVIWILSFKKCGKNELANTPVVTTPPMKRMVPTIRKICPRSKELS